MFNADKFKSFNDLTEFIKNHNINSKEEFIKKVGENEYKRIKSKFYKLRNKGVINKNNKFPFTKNKRPNIEWGNEFSKKEDFNEFLKTNNVSTPKELLERYPDHYRRLVKMGFTKDVVYATGQTSKRRTSSKNINSFNDIQNFVNENLILSKSDFKERFPGIYYHKVKIILSDKEQNQIKYFGINSDSYNEYKVECSLIKYGIYYEKGLKIYLKEEEALYNNKYYVYDFLIPEKNLIIEVHGRQHFNESIVNTAWNKNISSIKNEDYLKKLVAEKNGYLVKYFTYDIKDYEKYGYFDYVYSNFEKLLNDVGIKTNTISEEEYKTKIKLLTITSDKLLAISEINKYIYENKYTKREDVRINRPDLFWKIKKYNISSELKFWENWSLEDYKDFIKKRNIKTIDDIKSTDRRLIKDIRQKNFYNYLKIYLGEDE